MELPQFYENARVLIHSMFYKVLHIWVENFALPVDSCRHMARFRLLLATLLSTTTILGACSLLPEQRPTGKQARSATAPAEDKTRSSATTRKAPQATKAKPVAPSSDDGTTQAKPPPPPAPDLIGKSEQELIALLGRPVSEGPVGPGKMLRYAADGCAVELLLFPDLQSGSLRTLDLVESRHAGVSARECVARIHVAFQSGGK
jgi:hypothetical protein